jgi:hypothetical protein
MREFSTLTRYFTMSQQRKPRSGNSHRCKCGESRPEAMTRNGICYECQRTRQGCKPTELHHPFGRGNPHVDAITAEIPGNWHRVLDARRAQRPEIPKRPGGNPLHQIAAIAATFGEGADAVADFARRQKWPEWVAALCGIFAHGGQKVADWLLILAGKLDERLGPAWAEELGMPPWRP